MSAIAEIREKLVQQVESARNARSRRDRQSHYLAAFAYGDALRILRKGYVAEGREWPDGIGGRFIGPQIENARSWLGVDADDLLGTAV